MKFLVVLTATLIVNAQAWAECPAYLDQTLRKLHSQDSINLCDSFAGKPMLIVNTASHCGFTSQFKGLEDLHQEYQARGLVVVGFSSNDFNQEARDEAQAAKVCFVNNGVSFTMLAPSHVRGEAANPVFRQLSEQTQAPGWNFNKYLVDRDGNVVEHFESRVTPQSQQLRDAIEQLL
jgi:glutathione peroxidase